MAKSQESYNKKEVARSKEKKRKEKEKKRLERKSSSKDGNSLDNMIAYVDENGNITSTPPDPTKKVAINIEDIAISIPRGGSADRENPIRKGIVTFFNDSKGYGFIKDSSNQQSVFVHANELAEAIKENDKVTFEIAKGPKGYNAVNVKIDK